MLAKTHGQPASPTRLGKEVKVFACYNMASVFEIEKPIIANEFELIKFLEQNCYGG
jgi:adenylosuccinate lyase